MKTVLICVVLAFSAVLPGRAVSEQDSSLRPLGGRNKTRDPRLAASPALKKSMDPATM